MILNNRYRYLVDLLTVFICIVAFLWTGPAAAQQKADADSVSLYEHTLENVTHPDKVRKASQWLDEYYSQSITTDEAEVPDYKLPDPLIRVDGQVISDTSTWVSVRRPEILEMFEKQVYGRVPEFEYDMEFEVRSTETEALDGRATRKQVSILFDRGDPDLSINLLIYLPNHIEGPAPAVMGLNFYGNQSVHPDDGIRISDKWMRPNKEIGIRENRATSDTRGVYAERWQIKTVLQRGYGIITAYAGDIEPDEYSRIYQGVCSLAYERGERPARDEWGTIAAWAWGLQRMMDYVHTDGDIDSERIALIGHSRLGKTSLWSGALDKRFSVVISNNSGCGGAALSSRRFGETIGVINTNFPHWFCRNFNRFNNREDKLPLDQHMLLSLIAPRPLYVASAEDDSWADPKGEFLSARAASPVYELFEREGLTAESQPGVDQLVMGTIGYHMRSGGHGVTAYDWEQYLDFFDRYLKK